MDFPGTGSWGRPLTRARFLRLAAGSVAGLAVGTQAGCGPAGGPAPVDATPVRGGELTFARSQDPLGLDPMAVTDNGSIFLLYNVFDTLVTINADSTGVVPALATSWTTSTDGTRYVFTLRPGVRFSDGTPVTAQDVAFSLDRARGPDGAYAFLFSHVTRVTATAAGTVEVVLDQPYPPLIDNLSLFAAGIVPRAAVQRDPAAFAAAPVGTGPFRVASRTKGQEVVLARNEHYWKPGRPYLDRITVLFVPDDTARILKLRAGEAQLAENVPRAEVDDLRENPDLAVSVDPAFQLDAVFFNCASPILAKREVRQALCHAVDVDGINRSVYYGLGSVANGVTPKMRGWSTDVRPYRHDPAAARQLLAGAGIPAGTELPLLVNSGDATAVAAAQVIEQGWRAAGLAPAIQQVDFATLAQRLQARDFVALLAYETADVPSPWEMPQLTFSPDSPTKGMFTSVRSSVLSDAVAAGPLRIAPADQDRALREVQQLGLDEAPLLPISFPPTVTGHQAEVRGFRAVGTAWWRLEDVWLAR
ncbi:ABC transporter substrate-binding protein [Amycolatopsis sp. NBC_01307]|uniref:ABC transporter substrate-binding protein n=1 Tax=Amycolatopsis sp. NBC_01307 TaxID=2903561 RepID=UPI002E146E33|nr:ABC transporter substrate-binding protein [Amycolatopsis sp. NBC_01307]